jgi:hypothetical protein
MAIGYGIITYTGFALKIQTFSLLLTLMTLITLGAYLLIMISKKKDEKAQGIFLLAGLGGKFLLYLILILIFWSNGNNLTKEFIIVFFVLYLLLTIYLISVLYKVLKIK